MIFACLRPIVEPVLRQRAKRPEARAQREHHVRLRDELHGGLRALITEGADGQGVRGRERIVVQVAVAHGRAECVRKVDRLGRGARRDDSAAGDDHRKARACQQVGCGIECRRVTRPVVDAHRLRRAHLDLAVEEVARNIKLGGSHLEHGAVKAARGNLGHAARMVDVPLVLGDFRKNRQLLGFLEAAQPHRQGAGFRCDEHHGRMSPVSGRDSGHEIRDSGSVLRNAHAVPARRARVPVGHMNRALLVSYRHKLDARGGEDIERVHERRTDDPKYVRDTIRGERFNERLGGPHLLRLGHRLAPFQRSLWTRWFVSARRSILQYRPSRARYISL